MANPVFNDKVIKEAAHKKWPAPQAPSQGGQTWPAPSPGVRVPGIDDGPTSPWKSGVMTVKGSLTATAVLFVLLLVSATLGWNAVNEPQPDVVEFPALAMVGVIVGFVCVIALYFKPQFAKYLGPVYALAQGFAVGAISRAYEIAYSGIVVQAIGVTLGVFAVMLVLYRTQIIKVTDRFRRVVIFATLGIMVFYVISMLVNLFGGSMPLIHDSGPMGIAFSVFVAGMAALNLALDFDFIERGSKAGLPKDYEWVAAVGLLVTIVWLYLEILRLLSKLRN